MRRVAISRNLCAQSRRGLEGSFQRGFSGSTLKTGQLCLLGILTSTSGLGQHPESGESKLRRALETCSTRMFPTIFMLLSSITTFKGGFFPIVAPLLSAFKIPHLERLRLPAEEQLQRPRFKHRGDVA